MVEQDWRPKDLPSLDELYNGEDPITLFLPDMKEDDAWELLPSWGNSADVVVDFGQGHKLIVPGRC